MAYSEVPMNHTAEHKLRVQLEAKLKESEEKVDELEKELDDRYDKISCLIGYLESYKKHTKHHIDEMIKEGNGWLNTTRICWELDDYLPDLKEESE